MTSISYELAARLKEAGFPQIPQGNFYIDEDNVDMGITIPSLSELIAACGDDFEALIKQRGGWGCISTREKYMGGSQSVTGDTPEEAVVRLYLALNTRD